jgi:hypothetical protein
VDFMLGLAKNARLSGTIEAELAEARAESQATGQPARRFKELVWTTKKSWSRARRVIAKAEWTKGEANPRLIVTSLTAADGDGRICVKRSTALAARWRTARCCSRAAPMTGRPRPALSNLCHSNQELAPEVWVC